MRKLRFVGGCRRQRSTRMEACIWALSPLSLLPSSQAQGARTHLISWSGDTTRVPKLKQLGSPDSPPRCSQTALLPSPLLRAWHPAPGQVKQKRNGLTSQQVVREGAGGSAAGLLTSLGSPRLARRGRLQRAGLPPGGCRQAAMCPQRGSLALLFMLVSVKRNCNHSNRYFTGCAATSTTRNTVSTPHVGDTQINPYFVRLLRDRKRAKLCSVRGCCRLARFPWAGAFPREGRCPSPPGGKGGARTGGQSQVIARGGAKAPRTLLNSIL